MIALLGREKGDFVTFLVYFTFKMRYIHVISLSVQMLSPSFNDHG